MGISKVPKKAPSKQNPIRTIGKDTVQIVLVQEGQPVDSILLILSQLRVNSDREGIFVELAST
jgi:hypothetical protein